MGLALHSTLKASWRFPARAALHPAPPAPPSWARAARGGSLGTGHGAAPWAQAAPPPLALMEVGAGRLPVRSQRAWEGQAGNDPHLCPCWSPSAPSPLPVEALLPSTGRPGPALFGERACPWQHMLSVVLQPPSLGRIHFPLTLRRGSLLPLSPLTPVRKELMVKEGSGGHSDRARTRGHRERGRPKMA